MARNVEIKIRIDDLDAIEAKAKELATEPVQHLTQEDVFFHVPHGRLKLRIFAEDHAELIQYHRADEAGSKLSSYQIFPTSQPCLLRSNLAAALGESVTVKKQRTVYLVGQTRVHLDQVESLGTFLELEVVLRVEQTQVEGAEILENLLTRLGVTKQHAIAVAYADLLLERNESTAARGV